MSGVPSIPGYHIERMLGAGGMGMVFLADQESLHRQVAIKTLTSSLGFNDDFRKRFLREAQIVAKFRHPNIMRVYEAGTVDDMLYMVCEYYNGGTLKDRIANQSITPGESIRILSKLAEALAVAHDKGVFHRDIKPENVLFDDEGGFALADFGIAKSIDPDAKALTNTGAIIGTPTYMSPEQFKGETIDGRSDIYALGVVFYEMLTGAPPFMGVDPYALGIKHIKDPPPPLPENLSRYQPLLDLMLAKEPVGRCRDCHALAQHIEGLEQKAGTKAVRDSVRLREKSDDASRDRVAPRWVPLLGAAIVVFMLATVIVWREISRDNVPPNGMVPAHTAAESLVNATPEQSGSKAAARPSQGIESRASPQPETSGIRPEIMPSKPERALGIILSTAERQRLGDLDFHALEKHLEQLLADGKIGEIHASINVPNQHPNADRVYQRFDLLLGALEKNGMPTSVPTVPERDLATARAATIRQLEMTERQLAANANQLAERVKINRSILALDPANADARQRLTEIDKDFVQAIGAANAKSNTEAEQKLKQRARMIDPENVQFSESK